MGVNSLIPLRSHPGNQDRTATLTGVWGEKNSSHGAIYRTARGYLVTVSTRTPAGPVNMALPGFFATRGEAEAATERWEEKC